MVNSVIEDIKSRLNVVDFIGQYLRLQKAGANWKANCPFHNEKTPSFMVHEEKQIWHCFGCGKGGDIFSFLMEMERLEFKEALKALAEKAGVELKKSGFEKNETADKSKILEILDLASRFYEVQLWKGSGKEKILSYLRGRGISSESMKSFRLGYAPPGWRNLLTFLAGRGHDIKDIEKTGLLVKKDAPGRQSATADQYYDRFRDRITFPITDLMGKIIGFSARVAPGGDESQAKYVNTPETAVYHKSRVLYGIDKAKKEIQDKDEAVLVEGNTDVIASHQAGVKNTVAVSGTALTSEQLDILKRYSRNLKMFFDMDEAGRLAAAKSAKIAFQKGMDVSLVEIPEGKDAAELVARDPRIFVESVKSTRPAMERFLEHIFSGHKKDSPAGRKKIAEEALEIISHFESEIERNFWVKKLAGRLDEDVKIITGMLKKISGGKKSYAGKNAKEEEKIFSSRAEIIKKSLMGLMLAYPEIWKHVFEKRESLGSLVEDPEFSMLMREGKSSGFKIDNLPITAESGSPRDLFRQMAFESRYEFDAKGRAEEMLPEAALELAQKYLDEMLKEKKRNKIASLLKDIKKAEKSGNKEDLGFLVGEFNRLSKEIK